MSLICPKCGAVSPDDARFCEADGELLPSTLPIAETATDAAAQSSSADAASPGCPHCHAPADANVDGWCSACGRRWRITQALGRDHVETAIAPTFGGVTDRGKRHPINEDDFRIALTNLSDPAAAPAAIIVVCDGVSSSEDAHRASEVAASSICAELEAAVDAADLSTVLVEAIARANIAVNSLAPTTPGAASDPPETTVVAAVVRDGVVTIAWVGDSRAYWIKRDDKATTPDSAQLTHDHSWMNEVVESGEMTAEDAQKNRLAHAITRCLGGGSSDDPEGSKPSIAVFSPPPDSVGWMLLCTDGLWNYCDSVAQISALVAEFEKSAEATDATSIARGLVAWANAQGGRDNITVAMVRLGG